MMRKSLMTILTGTVLLSGLFSCAVLEELLLAPESSAESASEVSQVSEVSEEVPEIPVQVAVSSETETQKLYRLLNAYRAEKNLPPIPYSAKLAKTALAHAQDLSQNRPDEETAADGSACNLHSWSDQGSWTPVCYTSDHRESQKMWSKPAEVAGYKASGYEISAYSTGCHTAECWLAQWKSSPGHNQVMINEGIWANSTWKAVGIGLAGDFANIWFGKAAD